MSRPTHRRTRVLFMLLAILNPALLGFARAYEHSLPSNAVREAYFLGQRHDEKTTEFLSVYIKRPPMPDSGPYISEISLLTPYARCVLSSSVAAAGYSAQQAERDYHSRAEILEMKIRIEFTPTFTAVQPERTDKNSDGAQAYKVRPQDFWRTFRFELRQKGQLVTPQNTKGEAIYDDGGFRGAEVRLEYDSSRIFSAPASVSVVTPDNQRIDAEFDLSHLR